MVFSLMGFHLYLLSHFTMIMCWYFVFNLLNTCCSVLRLLFHCILSWSWNEDVNKYKRNFHKTMNALKWFTPHSQFNQGFNNHKYVILNTLFSRALIVFLPQFLSLETYHLTNTLRNNDYSSSEIYKAYISTHSNLSKDPIPPPKASYIFQI